MKKYALYIIALAIAIGGLFIILDSCYTHGYRDGMNDCRDEIYLFESE